jgi:hypothetical protein
LVLTFILILYLAGDIEVDKCSQYWPSSVGTSKRFGHIEVTNKSETIINQLTNTTLRTLELKGKTALVSFQIMPHYWNIKKVCLASLLSR